MKFFKLAIIILFSNNLVAQLYTYSEKKEDAYLAISKDQKKLSPQYKSVSSLVSTIQVNTDTSNMNIIGDAANEPSLAISPLNPNEMTLGWRQFDNKESNFRQAGIAYSMDGGESWVNIPPIEAGIFRSDPVLVANSEGKFFYNSLTENFSCDVFSSVDMQDWSEKTYAFGGDKQWMVVDNTVNNSNGNIYAFWKQQFSDCTGNFTRSLDNGDSFEECSFVNNNPTRGTLSVDPDGILYACGGWNNTYRVLRSESAYDVNSSVTWDSDKVVDLKGSQALYSGPNPGGMLGQVWVATDHSETESRGNVYLLSSTKRVDNDDPCDIMFSSSLDNGETWSEAIKINDDSSTDNWQWFGTMSTAPNGRIDVVWLDTRDNPDTYLSSLYYSFSLDEGLSWSENEKISEEFDPHLGWPNQQKMGDYFHMISFNDFAYLAWAATFNGEQDIFFSKIEQEPVSSNSNITNLRDQIEVYPNPFNERLNIKVSNPSSIKQIEILDISGEVVFLNNTIDIQNLISVESLNHLTQGVYFLKISFKNTTQEIFKIIKI